MQKEAKGCICPPTTPVCVCGHTPRLKIINRKVITASETEIRANPRARSAKLRTAEHIAARVDTFTNTDDSHFYDIGITKGNWRKPVLLQKIKMAFLTAS